MTGLQVLLLAAGSSSRMRGGDKLLEEVGTRPLLAERIETCAALGLPVTVALPPRAAFPARWAVAEGASCLEVLDAADGMGASLSAGVTALPASATGVLIVLADMPEITSDDMRALIDRFDGDRILRGASSAGAPGHPVLFPARDFAALGALSGDQGAKAVLQSAKARVTLVPLPESHALTDLDTPEAWAAWRAKNS